MNRPGALQGVLPGEIAGVEMVIVFYLRLLPLTGRSLIGTLSGTLKEIILRIF